MCECLAYEGGGMWLCEACAPDWLERETLDAERLARIEALEEALRDLLDYRPTFRDYTGTDWDTCAFCREPVEAAEHHHRPDCPWERLRTLLSTTKEEDDE